MNPWFSVIGLVQIFVRGNMGVETDVQDNLLLINHLGSRVKTGAQRIFSYVSKIWQCKQWNLWHFTIFINWSKYSPLHIKKLVLNEDHIHTVSKQNLWTKCKWCDPPSLTSGVRTLTVCFWRLECMEGGVGRWVRRSLHTASDPREGPRCHLPRKREILLVNFLVSQSTNNARDFAYCNTNLFVTYNSDTNFILKWVT